MKPNRVVRCLLIGILFFSFQEAFGYVAVLKNGKTIEGEVLFEDAAQIQIRDREGVTLTIRRSQIDSEATSRINEKVVAEPVKETSPAPSSNPVSVADVAREVKSRRSGTSKVWTKEDLKDLPEITVMGTDGSELEDDSISASRAEDEEVERAWKDAAMEIYQRMLSARQRYETLKKQCDDLSLATGFVMDYQLQGRNVVGSSVPGQAADACSRMELALDDLAAVEQEMQMLEEEARKKGIPPGWVDPLRY